MAMLGRGKRVIMVGGEGVVIYAPSGSGVVRETALSWEVPNFEEQLSEILAAQNQTKTAVIIFDGADQTYRKEENIPKLSMLDRARFVKRKLEIAFPAYSVRGAMEIKPPKVKGVTPPPPSYLFIAVPETENLDRVGRAVYESGVPVAGCGLLPTESSALVHELSKKAFAERDKPSRWAVLVGQHETGGLRQVVVKDGNLALTRLTPVGDGGVSGAAWAENVTREFRATLNYITRFGYNPADGLDVMIVCGSIEKQFFSARDMNVQNLACLTVPEALKLIDSPAPGFDRTNFADVVHAAWVSKKGALKFPLPLPSIKKIMGPRQAVQVASVLAILTAIGFAGLDVQSFYSTGDLRTQLEQSQNQKIMLEREYAQESKVFDSLPVKPDIVKTTLAVRSLAQKSAVDLPPILDGVKKAFGNDVFVDELSFDHIPDPKLNLANATATTSGGGPPKRASNPRLRPGQKAIAETGAIRLSFRFSLPASVPLEDKVKRADKLAADLKANFPNLTVEITNQFGKVKKGGRFSGGTTQDGAGNAAATESAEISMEGTP